MKKIILIISAFIWLAIAALVVFVLVKPDSEYKGLNGMFLFDTKTSLLKEDTVSLEQIENIVIESTSARISFIYSGSDDMKVTQYGSEKSSDEYTLSTEGGTVRVDARNRVRIHFGVFWVDEKIIVELPESWHGTVEINNSSGGVRVEDEFSWDNVVIDSTSGGIRFEKSLSAKKVMLRSSSGGIRIEGNMNVTGELAISSTSGGISQSGYVSAENLLVNSSSGGIHFDSKDTRNEFQIGCTSGGVTVYEITGSGSIKTSSGSIKAGVSGDTKEIDLKASSGGITITALGDFPFSFDGRTSSGGIRTDFDGLDKKSDHNVSGQYGSNPNTFITCNASSGGIKMIRG